MLYRLFNFIMEDGSSETSPFLDGVKIENGIVFDKDKQLTSIDAHAEDIEHIFVELLQDKKIEAITDGFSTYILREDIDLEVAEEAGYCLTILLDGNNRPIFIWNPITGKLSYDHSIKSYIKLSNQDYHSPYLMPIKKEEILIVGSLVYSGDDAYQIEIDDDSRAVLFIEVMQPKQSIFIKGKELMKYLLQNNIKYHEKCEHILFNYTLDLETIRDLMSCSCDDGHYNVKGVYFLDEQLDLNSVHFKTYRNTFILEIRNERSFYISVSSDDSYAFNLNTR